jgi:hypothetical protein
MSTVACRYGGDGRALLGVNRMAPWRRMRNELWLNGSTHTQNCCRMIVRRTS